MTPSRGDQSGDLFWIDVGPPTGSRAAGRRPVLIVQADAYTRSRLATVRVAVVTGNTALAAQPGNVFLPTAVTGLPRDSVVNVTSLASADRDELREWIGAVPAALLADVDRGLRRVLDR